MELALGTYVDGGDLWPRSVTEGGILLCPVSSSLLPESLFTSEVSRVS